MIQFDPKDPQGILDYELDWTDWLAGDTIATSTWTVPSGITKNSDTKTNTTTTIWLSGGSAGETYELVNEITTAGGRTTDRTVAIPVADL